MLRVTADSALQSVIFAMAEKKRPTEFWVAYALASEGIIPLWGHAHTRESVKFPTLANTVSTALVSLEVLVELDCQLLLAFLSP